MRPASAWRLVPKGDGPRRRGVQLARVSGDLCVFGRAFGLSVGMRARGPRFESGGQRGGTSDRVDGGDVPISTLALSVRRKAFFLFDLFSPRAHGTHDTRPSRAPPAARCRARRILVELLYAEREVAGPLAPRARYVWHTDLGACMPPMYTMPSQATPILCHW